MKDRTPWPWLVAVFLSGGAVECALSNWHGRPAPVETLWIDAVVICVLLLGGLDMPNFHDARTFALAWLTAALHAMEGAGVRAWLWLKAKLAAWERRAVLRLYAPAMLDCLKQLHTRVELLEKRGFEGESDVAKAVGAFIAKLG